MAERVGFEPSVQFWTPKSRRVRKLQIAKAQQRILGETAVRTSRFGPVSIRYSIDSERRTPGDSVAEFAPFRAP